MASPASNRGGAEKEFFINNEFIRLSRRISREAAVASVSSGEGRQLLLRLRDSKAKHSLTERVRGFKADEERLHSGVGLPVR